MTAVQRLESPQRPMPAELRPATDQTPATGPSRLDLQTQIASTVRANRAALTAAHTETDLTADRTGGNHRRRNRTAPEPMDATGLALAVLRALARPLAITVLDSSITRSIEDDALLALLRQHGLLSRPVILAENWAATTEQPMIGFAADDGRPLALIPRRRGYRVVDPATGSVTKPAAGPALARQALTLYRPLPAGTPSLPALLRFAIRGARSDVWLLVLGGLVAAVLGIGVPISAGTFVPRLMAGGHHPLVWTSALLVAAVLSSGFALQLRNAAAVRLQGRIQAALEPAIWGRLIAHDVGFFRDYSTGDLVHRANAIAQARQALSDVLVGAVLGAFFSVVGLTVLIVIAPWLGLTLLLAVIVMVVVMVALAKLRQSEESQVVALHGEIHGILYGLLRGIDKIQVAGREIQAYARWATVFGRMKRADDAAMRVDAFSTSLVAALQSLLLAVLLATIVLGNSSPASGHLLAAGVAAGQVALALGQVTHAATMAYGIAPTLDRLRPILAEPRETRRTGRDPGPLSGAVDIDAASFRYPGAAKAALDSVTLHADPGEFIAVVGPSGAGKSTIVRLLLGFDEPESGSVCYDRQKLTDLDLRRVRQQIGTVLQNGRMLQGSLLDNIAGPSSEVTEDEVWQAAELAGIADFMRRLPMGLRTKIGENAQGFSGGQVQRMLIARALVRRPQVLLLDEATSALDNTTQALIADRIAALRCTRIVIAHRLSTIRRADRIYLLDRGRVSAAGSYDELLDTDPLFTRLVRPQEL